MIKKLVLLALCAAPSWGAWSLVQSAGMSGSAVSVSATFMATPSIGDIIIVASGRGANGGNGVNYVTDNQAGNGNPYAMINWLPQNGVVGAMLYCSKVTQASGTFTVTAALQSGSDFMNTFALDYSGGSCDLDQVASGTGTSSPFSCGSITTLNANDLLLIAITNNSGGTVMFTPSAGFTVELQNNNGSAFEAGAVADQVVSSTGTFSPTFTSSNAQSNCVLAALRQASGGGGGGGTISAVFP